MDLGTATALVRVGMDFGGPGSGCRGDNCGRPKGVVSLPGSLRIPRNKLPQIKIDYIHHYLHWMKKRGIGHDKETVSAKSLKPIQKTIQKDKIERLEEKHHSANLPGRRVIISKDSYILDGHHRWYEALQTGEPLKVVRMHENMDQLLETTKGYPHAKYLGTQPKTKAA